MDSASFGAASGLFCLKSKRAKKRFILKLFRVLEGGLCRSKPKKVQNSRKLPNSVVLSVLATRSDSAHVWLTSKKWAREAEARPSCARSSFRTGSSQKRAASRAATAALRKEAFRRGVVGCEVCPQQMAFEHVVILGGDLTHTARARSCSFWRQS